jgi:hypothetical protein
MPDIEILTPDQLAHHVHDTVASNRRSSTYSHYHVSGAPTASAPYALIVGAGFSCGVVPLVRELMHETIGDYYVPDQDQSSMTREASDLGEHSATFWSELNAAAKRRGVATVSVDKRGLPLDAGAAYRALFEMETARMLFPGDDGARFVRGFLRYVVDPGSEHGHGSTGRMELNPAQIYLAGILEAQQTAAIGPFCRTIFTTNFDTLLQNALQMVNLMYRLTDRPETGFDAEDLHEEEAAIHLVYVHGSILRHNPASSSDELSGLSARNASVLRDYLRFRDVIAIGYGGWEDGLMAAVRQCDEADHIIYWCDVPASPSASVAEVLGRRGNNGKYISLGKGGADALMGALYGALLPSPATRDPVQRYAEWRALSRPAR